jgi:triosephosphate isomerase
MNLTLAASRDLMAGLREGLPTAPPLDLAVCPPYHLLFPINKELGKTGIEIGAQDVYFEAKGAFTGEIAPFMLKDTNCTYVIIGHSERRHVIGETGEKLNKKVRAAQAVGLHVIYCVGETLEQREAGRTEAVVAGQLAEAIGSDVNPNLLTIAYEPVWAIGTGKTASPDQAQEVHALVRKQLAGLYNAEIADAIRIQYGGSVKPDNAEELMVKPDVDGALVGGASLKADDFLGIIQGALKANNL